MVSENKAINIAWDNDWGCVLENNGIQDYQQELVGRKRRDKHCGEHSGKASLWHEDNVGGD